jgi:hypothetical protein
MLWAMWLATLKLVKTRFNENFSSPILIASANHSGARVGDGRHLEYIITAKQFFGAVYSGSICTVGFPGVCALGFSRELVKNTHPGPTEVGPRELYF